jgi:molecular chaperone DnaK
MLLAMAAAPTSPPQKLAPTSGAGGPRSVASPLANVQRRAGPPSGPIIGIDLGTTNSCVAFVKDGAPFVINSREGHNTIPSIIALNNRNTLVIGHPAKRQMLTNPKQTVFGAKRLIGRPYVSDIVQRVKDQFQYTIVEGTDGEAAVRLGAEVYSLQQVSAMILLEAREIASTHLALDVQRAVITVPAYYNEHQRQAVRAAGALAGLHVERIINEPTAAALAFGHRKKLEKRILVYDLGGGTFDASILHIGNSVYEVLATGGDTFLGGVDFDQAITDHLLATASETLGLDFLPSPEVRQRVTDAAEHAKRLLSEQDETRVHLPFFSLTKSGQPYDLDVVVTRAQLEELCSPLVARTIDVCNEVSQAARLGLNQIDEVLLVGGMSRMPLVHQAIERLTGKQPNAGVHPDEAVAIGAALFAHSLGRIRCPSAWEFRVDLSRSSSSATRACHTPSATR